MVLLWHCSLSVVLLWHCSLSVTPVVLLLVCGTPVALLLDCDLFVAFYLDCHTTDVQSCQNKKMKKDVAVSFVYLCHLVIKLLNNLGK